MTHSSTKAVIIVPTYREYDNLKELSSKVWKSAPDMHMVIVDDFSSDGTPDWVRSQPQFQKQLFLIERPSKLGLGTAYLKGFQWALENHYDYILQMDADLSHDPHQVPELLKIATDNGADLVLASRYLRGVRILNWPIARLLLSKTASLYVRVLTGMPYTDPTGGFKCWSRSLLEKYDFACIRSVGYAFQIEMTYIAWKLGAQIIEVPTVFEGRHAGSSKLSSISIVTEGIRLVLQLALKGSSSIKHRRNTK